MKTLNVSFKLILLSAALFGSLACNAQSRAPRDSTGGTPIGVGIDTLRRWSEIDVEKSLNIQQDGRIVTLHTKLAPLVINPDPELPDLTSPCATLSDVNAVPFVDPTGRLDSSCHCKNGGVFPKCTLTTCVSPEIYNPMLDKCEMPRVCNAASIVKTWGLGCEGLRPGATNHPDKGTLTVSNTNPLYTADSGQTYICDGNTGDFVLQAETCNLKGIECTHTSGNLAWDSCWQDVPTTVKKVGEAIVTHNQNPSKTATSTATFVCKSDGTFELQIPYICDTPAAVQCERIGGSNSWGGGCSGNMAGGMYNPGDSISATNSATGFTTDTSVLIETCLSNGTWAQSSACNPITAPIFCPATYSPINWGHPAYIIPAHTVTDAKGGTVVVPDTPVPAGPEVCGGTIDVSDTPAGGSYTLSNTSTFARSGSISWECQLDGNWKEISKNCDPKVAHTVCTCTLSGAPFDYGTIVSPSTNPVTGASGVAQYCSGEVTGLWFATVEEAKNSLVCGTCLAQTCTDVYD